VEEGGIQGDDRSYTRQRLTVAEAAEALGVTVDAIRSRIKRDTITHVREEGRVYIILGDDQYGTKRNQYIDQGSAQYTEQEPSETQDKGYYDELLEELRDRVRYLEEESRRKDHLLAAALERIPAIEAPPDTSVEPRESPQTASEEPSGTQASQGYPQEERRSWWQRLFGGD
jgi:hypothetical protein